MVRGLSLERGGKGGIVWEVTSLDEGTHMVRKYSPMERGSKLCRS